MPLGKNYKGEYYIPSDFRTCFIYYYSIMGKPRLGESLFENVEYGLKESEHYTDTLGRDMKWAVPRNPDPELLMATLKMCLKPKSEMSTIEKIKSKIGLM